ncbi:MAG TPA: choice-of-anchor Q domain-containing protein [Anaerolineales bacterium]|nr:choice-of-anchor Q domain-containing protein [Anaerolineales bacterium]
MKTKTRFLNLFLALCLALGALAAMPVERARAATLVVTNTSDSGAGSLREALDDANDGDVIDATGISGTITLASQLTVSDNVTINGPGASSLTVSGDNAVRVFYIDAGKTVVINDLTVANGKVVDDEGGGIRNHGNLTLNVVTVTGNQALDSAVTVARGGGIYNDASLSMNGGSVTYNTASQSGGGIFSDPVATGLNLDGVLISNNTASDSGGLHVRGPAAAAINDASVTNNSAGGSGGGLYADVSTTITNSLFAGNDASGGGGLAFYGNSQTFSLTNVTISGNSADAGGGVYEGNGGTPNTLNLNNVTITDNAAVNDGGGMYVSSTVNLKNTIMAGNTAGDDSHECYGTLNSQGYNLIQATAYCTVGGDTTGNITGTDPLLGALANNGGPTSTHALSIGSPAIDAGNNLTCAAADQRGETRLFDGNNDTIATCDMGAYERTDIVAPTVASITRAETDPTAAAAIDFTVTFSESVTGVDTSDFTLATSGVSGATVSGVSGSGATRTVTVNTGSGNGTIRLDLSDDDSIADAGGNLLGGTGAGNGDFTSGETYTVQKMMTFRSVGAQDGWVLESSETSNKGGTFNSAATAFRLGDDAARKQYRAILSFNTSGLPDNAVITKVTLKVKRQSVTGGGNPVNAFQGFMADVKKGMFGTSALQAADFQTAANKTVGPLKPPLVGGWYSLNLTGAGNFVNKLATAGGITQVRLRFKLDDNNNAIANYLSLFSGNAPLASRPQLIVEYYVP